MFSFWPLHRQTTYDIDQNEAGDMVIVFEFPRRSNTQGHHIFIHLDAVIGQTPLVRQISRDKSLGLGICCLQWSCKDEQHLFAN